MGRNYGYSPSPPRGYRRRVRSPSPRGRYGGRGRDLPTSLLVRNLRRDCRPDDLHRPFGRFGRVKDIYLPRDYYSQEPRGFGFVQYYDPDDAADAKYYLDGQILLGREISVVFAEDKRKKPDEMRTRERTSSRGRSYERRSRSPRCARLRSPGYSDGSRSRSRSYSPAPNRKRYSRSPAHRERSLDLSRSPVVNRLSRSPSKDRGSRSPPRQRSLSVTSQ